MMIPDLSCFSTILLLLSYLSSTIASPLSRSGNFESILTLDTPIPTDNLSSLIKYHVSHIIQTFTEAQYNANQPTTPQRLGWRTVVTSLLNINDKATCSSVTIPDALKGLYTVTEVDHGKFCALVEVIPGGQKVFTKGWGIFVVPTNQSGMGPKLHLSAPHPVFELDTAEEATHVFGGTGATSLYVPGRSSEAFTQKTGCIPSTPKNTYYKTDATHDNNEMLFETYVTIVAWQNDPTAGGGCSIGPDGRASCAYIEFFGKGLKTCIVDQIFLAAGLGRDPDSLAWYKDPAHAHIPMFLLSASIKTHFPSTDVHTPISSSCSLTGTTNIIGRLINGISEDHVCKTPATPKTAKGHYVQIEQDPSYRMSENWETWVKVFLDAFKA